MELSQAFNGFVDSGNAKMEMDIVLGFMKQCISSNCRAWTRRVLAKFDKIWEKTAMGKYMELWEKRDLYRTGKTSRMKVNHRKGGGVPGRGN